MDLKKTVWIVPGCYILLVLLRPTDAAQATRSALSLWANQVLPTLAPCFMGALMLEKSGILSLGAGRTMPLLQKLYGMDARLIPLLALCWCAGFPTGAKIIREQADKGLLTPPQARTAIGLCSTVSPGFILGALGAGILKSPFLGRWMLFAHLLSALICGALFAQKSAQTPKSPESAGPQTLSGALCQSLGQTGQAMLSIAASMTFFSVLLCFLPGRFALFAPVLEMTAGCASIGDLPLSAGEKALALCGAVCFGGVCLGVQSLSYIGELLPAKSYFLRKTTHCIIAVALMLPVLWL